MEELVVSILRSFSFAFIYGKMKLIQLTTVKVDCLGIVTANRMIDDHAWAKRCRLSEACMKEQKHKITLLEILALFKV